MPTSIRDCTTLNNGVKMPWLGLGVYKSAPGQEVETAVRIAIENGYRSVDTAKFYDNEEGVGKAIRDSGVKREDIFVTTKVWNTDQGYERTLQAFEASRKRLGMDYVDLYLIHWPGTRLYKETWKALEKLYKDGYVRAIGVCNFKIHHLENLLQDCEFVPMVNQVEFHPRLTQADLLAYCKQHNIQMEAWAPLMRGRLMNDPTVNRIAKAHGKTPAQVLLRWDLDHGVVTIPKSVREERIKENSDIFDFSLTAEEIAALDALNADERTGPDPDTFDF